MSQPTPPTKEIALVGRLAPWKAGRLAVRAMRDVSHRDAVLHIYGSGHERQSILEAARRWGIEHRNGLRESWHATGATFLNVGIDGVLVSTVV
jgi:hypothetical protein